MTPDVFNAAFSLSYGIGYWSDDPNATIVQLGFFLALLANLKAFYQTLIAQKSSFPPPTQFSPMILKWAQAIAKAEGAKSSLNNPGDLKVSTLTQSWGAGYGFQATDGGWIASFNTPQAGMNALCNFLKLGCENELIAFHSPEARTLGGFTQIFAGNPPPSYLEIITTELGVPADTQISTFL